MNFRREKKKDLYLRDTQVENMFITEYMADADGDFVKVYLFALMYAESEEVTNAMIARHLNMAEEDVLRAWNYWESAGVIRKHHPDPADRFHYAVEFLNLREKLYSPSAGADEEDESFDDLPDELMDRTLKDTFDSICEVTGRLLESTETRAIQSWLCEYDIEPALVIYAYRYCKERRGIDSYRYVATVVNEWERAGIRTLEAARRHLADTDERHAQYKRIQKALGFTHNLNEDAQAKVDTWFDTMGFGMERILEACAKTSGISSPNINYVNKVLTNWYNTEHGISNQGTTPAPPASSAEHSKKNAVALVKKHYEELRKKSAQLLEDRRQEAISKAPKLGDIEEKLRSDMVNLSRSFLRGRGTDGRTTDEIRQHIDMLEGEKAALLLQAGLAPDYLELQYECRECKDTGELSNGQRCSCFAENLKRFV